MIWLTIAAALAGTTELTVDGQQLRIAIVGDVHTGGEHRLGSGRESLREALEAAATLGADSVWLSGDIAGDECFGGPCVTSKVSADYPFPHQAELDEIDGQVLSSGYPRTRIHAITGNHDGDPTWLASVFDPADSDGYTAHPGSRPGTYSVKYRLTCGGAADRTLEVVGISSENDTTDRVACGRTATPEHKVVHNGMPAGAIRPWQAGYLAARVVARGQSNKPLMVVSHHVPPETTVGSWAQQATGVTPPCRSGQFHGEHGSYTGTWAQGQRPDLNTTGWHRTDLLGRRAKASCNAWGGTVAYLGDDPYPDPSWARDYIGAAVDVAGRHTVAAWFGSHTHVPHPRYEAWGRSTVAQLQPNALEPTDPITVVQTGGMARRWCNSGDGSCLPMFMLVTLDCDGTWQGEWIAVDSSSPKAACGADTVMPATTPTPFLVAPVTGTW